MKETEEKPMEHFEKVEGAELTFEEAEKIEEREGLYFKPETNREYKLTFSTWKLVMRNIPAYRDPKIMERKVVLELRIDGMDGETKTMNGEPLNKEWGIISKKCRNAFEPFCEADTITKRIFTFKQKGENQNRVYQLADVGERKEVGQKAPASSQEDKDVGAFLDG